MDDLVKRLRAVDHGSIEDCFTQSPLFERAAAAIEARDAMLRECVEALGYVLGRIQASEHWWIDCPDRGGFDVDRLEGAIARAKEILK